MTTLLVVRRLAIDVLNLHTKFEVSKITCNKDMKGNAQCKNSRFERRPFGGLRDNAQSSYIYAHCQVTHPFRKRRFRRISLNSASAVRASENSSIVVNRKSTMGTRH